MGCGSIYSSAGQSGCARLPGARVQDAFSAQPVMQNPVIEPALIPHAFEQHSLCSVHSSPLSLQLFELFGVLLSGLLSISLLFGSQVP